MPYVLILAAGIPDFRSPSTGIYDNLEEYGLPSPMSVFDISYFEVNPLNISDYEFRFSEIQNLFSKLLVDFIDHTLRFVDSFL